MNNPYRGRNPPVITVSPFAVAKLVGAVAAAVLLGIAALSSTTVVEPGNRGVRVTLGRVSTAFEGEGLKFKLPFITRIYQVSVRQQTVELATDCYSSDLQQVRAALRILYRIPENAVVPMFRGYEGSEYSGLIEPRVVEALKEAASSQSAELIVQNREVIKQQTLEATRKKIGDLPGGGPLILIEDITLSDLALSAELNTAIEQKMTQREETERAKYVQKQAEIEAQTVIIKAKGDAESLAIRGKALRANPAFLDLQIVEKWDGIAPQVVGGGSSGGANILIPLPDPAPPAKSPLPQ
jgi:prohibitin 2